MTDRLIYHLWCASFLTGLPNQRKAHEGIYMIRALKHQTVIALQFTMIGGEEDIGLVIQVLRFQVINNPLAGFVNQLIFDMRHRIDFAHLVSGHVRRHILSWRLKVAPETRLIVAEPVFGFGREHPPSLIAIQIGRWQIKIAPVHAMKF